MRFQYRWLNCLWVTILSILMLAASFGPPKPWPAPAMNAAETAIDKAFYHVETVNHVTATHRYMLQQAAGASDSNDCTTPTYQGGTVGPCLSFSAAAIAALDGGSDYKLFIGPGTYAFSGPGPGVQWTCAGNANDPCIITAYDPTNRPKFTGSGFSGNGTLFAFDGDYFVIEYLDFPYGSDSQYQIRIGGDTTNMVVRYNTLAGVNDNIKTLVTVVGGPDNDLFATDVFIYRNSMTDPSDNGIDIFGGHNIIVRENKIVGARGSGILAKAGSVNVIITHNLLESQGGAEKAAIEMGGTGSGNDNDATAESTDMVVHGNTLRALGSASCALFRGCVDCTLTYNRCKTQNRGVRIMEGGDVEEPDITANPVVTYNHITIGVGSVIDVQTDAIALQLTSDYNIFVGVDLVLPLFKIAATSGNLPAWRAGIGEDTHSQVYRRLR